MKPKTDEPRVISKMVSPGGSLTKEQLDDQRFEQKRREDQQRIDSLKVGNRNKMARFLNAQVLFSDWTHKCLYDAKAGRQMSVSEFYPELGLAVDKFYDYGKEDELEAQNKKVALNAAGFKYVALTPQKDMADAWVEIEEQGLKVA